MRAARLHDLRPPGLPRRFSPSGRHRLGRPQPSYPLQNRSEQPLRHGDLGHATPTGGGGQGRKRATPSGPRSATGARIRTPTIRRRALSGKAVAVRILSYSLCLLVCSPFLAPSNASTTSVWPRRRATSSAASPILSLMSNRAPFARSHLTSGASPDSAT